MVTPTTGEAGWAAAPTEQRGGGPGQAVFPNLPRWIPHSDPEDSPLPGLRRQETDPQTEAREAGGEEGVARAPLTWVLWPSPPSRAPPAAF